MSCYRNLHNPPVTYSETRLLQVVIQKMPYPPYNITDVDELSNQFVIRLMEGLIFVATICLIPSYVSAERTGGVNVRI